MRAIYLVVLIDVEEIVPVHMAKLGAQPEEKEIKCCALKLGKGDS